jgi:hypothetical protein
MPTKKTADGKEMRFDENLLDWVMIDIEAPEPVKDVGPQQLNLFDPAKIDLSDWTWSSTPKIRLADPDPPTDYKFVCGKCGGTVVKFRKVLDWQTLPINPETGTGSLVSDRSTVEVHDIRYECSMGCGWKGTAEWWAERDSARIKAKESGQKKEAKTNLFDYYQYPFTTRTNRK